MESRKSPLDHSTYVVDGITCRRLPLRAPLYAIVNEFKYDTLIREVWCIKQTRHKDDYYANRYFAEGGKAHFGGSMQRFIFGDPGEGMIIDHKDHRTLNNLVENLRAATLKENQGNRRMNRNNASGYIGVAWDNLNQKWLATLKDTVNHGFNLGRFDDKEEAARVRDAKAIEVFGEFAVLNFPLHKEVTEMSILYPFLTGNDLLRQCLFESDPRNILLERDLIARFQNSRHTP